MPKLLADEPTTDIKADWLLVFTAALSVGDYGSFDELLLRGALNAWLDQMPLAARWKIALELYTTEQVSTGRAAEIAGLGYIMFMEKLREQRIPLMAAIVTNDAEREREEALLDELLSI